MANFNFNKVILGGRLTADPELKTTTTGTPYVNFTVAVNRPFSSKNEDQQQVDFISCIAWRQRAEFLSRYFRKGSSVCVVGTIQTRSWTDNQGNKRYGTDVVADEINFVDSKGEGPQGGSQGSSYVPSSYSAPSFTTDNAPKFEDVTDDEELPF